MRWRYSATAGDRDAVRALVAATGFFSREEEDIAVELVEDALARGEASEYRFVFADAPGGALRGYACYGPITPGSADFDLYWIAVAPQAQREGTGRALLAEAERLAVEEGATAMFIDTAGRSQYAPTRAFYERMGYCVHRVAKDFYAVGDDKVVYRKSLR
ncbi:MAG TPA: GNAT family N-acetyltransferase [Woeseiaceae bacterium]|nr:GNAT family N-acetyltransferase [Woeseiaceae bacterium]